MRKVLRRGLLPTLAVVMVLALAACDDQEKTTTAVSATADETTMTLQQTTTATLQTTTTTLETTSTTLHTTTTSLPAQQPISLKYATTFAPTETGGQIIRHFCDYVEEATTGAVTFDIYFDGGLGNSLEELGLVTSGSVDMVCLDHTAFADQLPFLNFPPSVPGDGRAAIDYFDHLVFANPETSMLILEEAARDNVTYLGFTLGGPNVFISKAPLQTLADLKGRKLGAAGAASAFNALGCTVVASSPSDTRDSLSSGALDAGWMGFEPALELECYESCKFYIFDGTYTAGRPFTINLDAWAKLTPETQAIFHEAARQAETFSLALETGTMDAASELLSKQGVKLGSLGDADAGQWAGLLFKGSAEDCLARAEQLGIIADMTKVLKTAAGFTGVVWPGS